MEKKLYRSNNRMLAGVCAGLAEYMNVDPTIIRLAYAALTLFTAGIFGLILYVIMMIIIPEAPHSGELK